MKSNVRVIFHIDMNAFFASVEEIVNPFLKNKPFAVCSRYSNKGVVSTASYAARKFGVGSAMSKMDALKKCPQLICVDHHFDLYHEYSILFMNLFKEYTNKVEQVSIDEAFLDMTEVCEEKNGLELAKEIQERLLKEIGLPCSIGIGPNLLLAKMGSDYKKPLGITVIRYRDVKKMIWPLPIGDLFGIGKKTVPRLNSIGIYTIGDLANYKDEEKLISVFGENFFVDARKKANGISSDKINLEYEGQLSVGNSRTFDDTFNDDILYEHLRYITSLVVDRLKKGKHQGKTVSIQIKYSDFTNVTRSKTLNRYIDSYNDIYEIAEELFEKNWNGKSVRLLGVSLSNIKKEETKEMSLFDVDVLEHEQKIIDMKKELRKRFGDKVIK